MVEVHNNLGLALMELKRPGEAEACFREGVRLRPEMAEVHNHLALALLEQERPAEAMSSLHRAIQLKPGFAEAQSNLGTAWWRLGRFQEALGSYAAAVRDKPDYVEAHCNAGLVRLLLGEFEKGWEEYEWEWRQPRFSPPAFLRPRWDGSPLPGRTIMLYAERGLGDAILFVRYARLLQERGARVVVACQRPLTRILARCPGIDQLIAQGDALPPYDLWAPLMGLPFHLGTRVDTIPATLPYLWADPVLVDQWRRVLEDLPGFKIGIAWQGNPHYSADGQRSFRLMEFAPLAEVPGVRLVSLQKGPGSEQLRTVDEHWPLTDLGCRLDETAGAFMDTAAVMMSLDLIVTSDTAIANLAGAMGLPAWVALPAVPDWRWLLDRDDCPWYPSTRLFRQDRPGDWPGVFRRIAEAVQELIRRRATGDS
jgi:hypothetical protein